MLVDLVRRRDGATHDIALDTHLYNDLRLDSLEVAELSAMLEDAYGTDPYTEGYQPATVADIVGFYPG